MKKIEELNTLVFIVDVKANKCTYAFFLPSGRISVFTFAAVTSYICATASLIWLLFALTSTMKTRVLSSSIFFIADSVVRGYLIMRNLSMTCRFATDLRGYIGLRACFNVFGRKKWTFLRTLVCFFAIDFFATLAAVC